MNPLNSITPELPFDQPEDANTTSIETNTVNGKGTTKVAYTLPDADGEQVVRDISQELNDSGWGSHTAQWDTATEEGAISGTKGDETLDVRVSQNGGSVQVEVVWTY